MAFLTTEDSLPRRIRASAYAALTSALSLQHAWFFCLPHHLLEAP